MNYVLPIIIGLCFLQTPIYAQISWIEHDVSTSYDGPSSLTVVDIDNDSLLDILTTAIHSDKITWWKNQGGTPVQWIEYDIATSFNGAAFAYPIDLDQDGDLDIAGAAWYGHEIAWWENLGGVPITWSKHSIDDFFRQAHEVYATDMDHDGDIDVLGASAYDNEIAWWRNDGGDTITWTKFVIDSVCNGARSARAYDMNGDSLIDVVGGALLSHDVAIYYMIDDSTWFKDFIDPSFYGTHMVRIADIDDDNDMDVVACAYQANAIAWYRNDGGDTIQWHKQIIDGTFYAALGVHAADINEDGNMDVLGTADASDQVACWYNDGYDPITWTKQVIAPDFNGAWPVHAGDIDNDNDLDVASGAATVDEISWWENTPTGINEQHAWDQKAKNLNTTIVSGPLPVPEDTKYQIYDITGQRIHTLEPAPGIYFVAYNDNVVQKIIVVK